VRDLTAAMVLSADLILMTVPLTQQYASNPKSSESIRFSCPKTLRRLPGS